jgi:hypothetical protein
MGQADGILLTGNSSACEATANRLGRAKLHPNQRFAPWLRKTYAK